MASDKPRPNKNSDGQDKKPSANPDGGGAPPAPTSAPPGSADTSPPVGGGPPQLMPGQVQVMQTAGALGQIPPEQSGIPSTPGAGVPEGLQSFPQDAAALMGLIQQGYAPGSDGYAFSMAQNAHAVAKAQEAAAEAQHNDSIIDEQHQQLLNALQQSLAMSGRLPTPPQAAQQMAAPQGPPQLQPGMMGPPQA